MVKLRRALSLALASSAAGLEYFILCLCQFLAPSALCTSHKIRAPWSSSNQLIVLNGDVESRVKATHVQFWRQACNIYSLPLPIFSFLGALYLSQEQGAVKLLQPADRPERERGARCCSEAFKIQESVAYGQDEL
jgi:hypothetical protein